MAHPRASVCVLTRCVIASHCSGASLPGQVASESPSRSAGAGTHQELMPAPAGNGVPGGRAQTSAGRAGGKNRSRHAEPDAAGPGACSKSRQKYLGQLPDLTYRLQCDELHSQPYKSRLKDLGPAPRHAVQTSVK